MSGEVGVGGGVGAVFGTCNLRRAGDLAWERNPGGLASPRAALRGWRSSPRPSRCTRRPRPCPRATQSRRSCPRLFVLPLLSRGSRWETVPSLVRAAAAGGPVEDSHPGQTFRLSRGGLLPSVTAAFTCPHLQPRRHCSCHAPTPAPIASSHPPG